MRIYKLPDKNIEELEKVQRQFWWNKESEKGIIITAWRNLCKDKDPGRLGFRDMKCFNITLQARSTWIACKKESQLWEKALKEKHFPDYSLLHAPEKNNTTLAWKNMYSTVAFTKRFSFWQLGDVKRIYIWMEKWVLRDTPKVKCIYRNGYLMADATECMAAALEVLRWSVSEQLECYGK
ncbi:uncharacterized protein LOC113352382 [Papaver somniferum]|uniref:uncharacterized protein LOC113352382 n=1 Tax=Papaver somniferum TaxID=3469 RepID=UPI000E704CBB|nr:uncharacterized protein LOC113352382 [Papaver somniferum]